MGNSQQTPPLARHRGGNCGGKIFTERKQALRKFFTALQRPVTNLTLTILSVIQSSIRVAAIVQLTQEMLTARLGALSDVNIDTSH